MLRDGRDDMAERFFVEDDEIKGKERGRLQGHAPAPFLAKLRKDRPGNIGLVPD
jgi:hypothetical protein